MSLMYRRDSRVVDGGSSSLAGLAPVGTSSVTRCRCTSTNARYPNDATGIVAHGRTAQLAAMDPCQSDVRR